MVTNMWPHRGNPKYGIFVKRQIDSLLAAGVPSDVFFIRGHLSPAAYPGAALELALWNLRRRYSLVHAHGGESALSVRSYLRAPVLISYCGDDLLGTPRADGSITRSHRIRRWALQQDARLQTATVTKSAEMARYLPAAVQQRNTVIPNGVDIDRFRPLDRADARAQLGWDEDERIALFAADPEVERKRHWLADEACGLAGRRLDGVRLHVASDVSPDQMPVLMSAADCLLLTSVSEGSPNVVKEALMCNLPVVATPVGDVSERLLEVAPSWLAGDARRPGGRPGRVPREASTIKRSRDRCGPHDRAHRRSGSGAVCGTGARPR